MMEPDNEFKGSEGQNDIEVLMLNQHKCKSTLGHPKVILRVPVEPGRHWMMALQGFVDSCSTVTIIHLSILKHMNHKIEQGEESVWKTAARVTWMN